MASTTGSNEELATLPHNNEARQLLASIWTLSFLATVFLSLRIYCRLLKRQRLGWDDGILIASWVTTYAHPSRCVAFRGC